ncbi:MAG: hypothetical protein P8Z37_05010 [Acidobacteriota bacterium]
MSRQYMEETAFFTQNPEDRFQGTVTTQRYDPAIEAQTQIQTRTMIPVKLMQYTVEMTGPALPEPIYQRQMLQLLNAIRERPQPILR